MHCPSAIMGVPGGRRAHSRHDKMVIKCLHHRIAHQCRSIEVEGNVPIITRANLLLAARCTLQIRASAHMPTLPGAKRLPAITFRRRLQLLPAASTYLVVKCRTHVEVHVARLHHIYELRVPPATMNLQLSLPQEHFMC